MTKYAILKTQKKEIAQAVPLAAAMPLYQGVKGKRVKIPYDLVTVVA